MQVRRTGRTPHEVEEVPPDACSNGHPFGRSGYAFLGFLPCTCAGGAGHRTYRCAVCDVVDCVPAHDWSVAPTLGSVYDD